MTLHFDINLNVNPQPAEIVRLLNQVLNALGAQGQKIMAVSNEMRKLITDFDTATNDLAAKIDALKQQITDAGMSKADEDAAIAELDTIRNRLATLASDPNNPVP